MTINNPTLEALNVAELGYAAHVLTQNSAAVDKELPGVVNVFDLAVEDIEELIRLKAEYEAAKLAYAQSWLDAEKAYNDAVEAQIQSVIDVLSKSPLATRRKQVIALLAAFDVTPKAV